jgi:hypothetical protein
MPENNQSSSGFIPTIIVALLAAYGITGSVSKAPPALAVTSTLPASGKIKSLRSIDDQEYPDSAAGMLEDYLATTPVAKDEKRPWRQSSPTGDPPDTPPVDFMIATLPEPASPALRSEFDNDLEGNVSAITDSGYTLDNFDMPWDDDTGSATQSQEKFPAEIDAFARGVPWDIIYVEIERSIAALENPARTHSFPA